jgi:hypothetical protein
MAQAVDGNWYGYFADRNMALIADSTAGLTGQAAGLGLDFGTFCSSSSTTFGANFFSDTVGYAIPGVGTGVGQNGTSAAGAISTVCADLGALTANGTGGVAMNVVREAKDLNTNTAVAVGQIGLGTLRTAAALDGVWPIAVARKKTNLASFD